MCGVEGVGGVWLSVWSGGREDESVCVCGVCGNVYREQS